MTRAAPVTRPHPPPALPAAHALLLAVARAALREDGGAEGHLPLDGIDWDAFLLLAERNRLLPLAHRLLGDRAGVPEEVRARLRAAYARNGRQALARSGRLEEAAAMLHRPVQGMGKFAEIPDFDGAFYWRASTVRVRLDASPPNR